MTENDEINENFTLTKQKKLGFYKQRSIDVWLGKNFGFNYVNIEHEKPSLPCPTEGCICGTFSRIFDYYDPNIRCRMLSRSKPNKEISWQWDDWDIEGKSLKISMKISIALHLAKCMYITQNPDSKLLRQDLKHLVKVHTIDMIPILWRTCVLIKINLHMLTFRENENKVEV